MAKKWRIILDNKYDGYYNMALDEALLNNYSLLKIPTLRIYGFNCSFISLGYNQSAEEVLTSDNNIPIVRRITGGGSILHKEELTYSLVCSNEDLNLDRNIKKSYKVLCSFLINFYAELGLKANFAEDIFNTNLKYSYSNFCFSNYMPFDLMISGKKIGGNAQRRRKNIIFQQGCIPQAIDFRIIYNSIRNVNGIENKVVSLKDFVEKDFFSLQLLLKETFCKTFFVECFDIGLLDIEIEMCSFLMKEKYSTFKWNYKKNEETILVK